MSNEKIKVTVHDGAEVREYEGDLVHLNVFNRIEDGMNMSGETAGAHYVPVAVIDGAVGSILQTINRLSRTPEAERELLTVMAEKLVKRMEKLDKQESDEPKPSGILISGEGAKQFLKDILAVMEEV